MEIEELQAEILKLKDEITELTSAKDEQEKELNSSKERIQKLQQANQELFIRCTAPVDKNPGEKRYKSIEEISKEMRKK